MPKAVIARHLKVSRRTVYNWIEAGELDRGADSRAVRYGPRPRRPSKLDPYQGIIDARLAEYPKLSAVRLFDEVQTAGYAGGYGQVKRYVRTVRPREPMEPVRRFETPPGHQGQVDFADFRLPWGKRHALIVVLSYSRRMWLRFYERQTMPVVMRGLEASFAYFGGVPSELLFDRDNFFYGRDFVSDDDLNAGTRLWLDSVANARVHGTLKERVADRFDRERPYLSPLAPWPYRPVVPRSESWTTQAATPSAPQVVEVQRRPLSEYAGITGALP